jgi:SAM-dependent methyltransferase
MHKRLICGCGQNYVKNDPTYEDVTLDLRPFAGVDVVHDLNKTPWPFADNSFAHVSALHVVEHLETRLLPFMDEAHRVLQKGGSLYIETPYGGPGADLQLAWADPTHVRCYTEYSFANYFSLEGVHRWGYTDKAWCFIKLAVENSVLIFHGMPIKE